MAISVMSLRRRRECQCYLFDAPDEKVYGLLDALERFESTRVLADWVSLPLEQFPNRGAATSRFGYMAGHQNLLIYPAERGPELADAAPGFVPLPVSGRLGLAVVPGDRGIASGSDAEVKSAFQPWPPLEVSVDFVEAAVPRGRFFALDIGRRWPTGLLLAVEDGVEPPALYRWLVDDPGSGWSATEVWNSANGPIPFWR
jgi:hypothetical protein